MGDVGGVDRGNEARRRRPVQRGGLKMRRARTSSAVIPAKQRRADANELRRAADLIQRYAADLPVNLGRLELVVDLLIAAAAIGVECAPRGGQTDPAIDTAIMD